MKKLIIILSVYSILIAAYAIISEFFRVGKQIEIVLVVPIIHLVTLMPIIIMGIAVLIYLKKEK